MPTHNLNTSKNGNRIFSPPREQEYERLRQLNQLYQDVIVFTGHEWRNQVSLLSLNIDLLNHHSNTNLTEQQKNILKRIRQGAHAVQRIARNYLTLLKTEHLAGLLHATWVDPVQDVIEPLLFSYADLLVMQEQTYELRIDEPGLQVWADQDLLISVYDNLLNNAIRYGITGGKIVLSVEKQETTDKFSIWSNGISIPADKLNSIFDVQPHISTDALNNGSDVGFYLARQIVEAHGGQIWCEAMPEGGNNFIFTLPRPTLNSSS